MAGNIVLDSWPSKSQKDHIALGYGGSAMAVGRCMC